MHHTIARVSPKRIFIFIIYDLPFIYFFYFFKSLVKKKIKEIVQVYMNLKEIAEARNYFGGCGLCSLHNLILSRSNKILKLHSTSRGSSGRGRPDWFFPFLFFFCFLFNLEFCCVCAFKFSAIIYTWKREKKLEPLLYMVFNF